MSELKVPMAELKVPMAELKVHVVEQTLSVTDGIELKVVETVSTFANSDEDDYILDKVQQQIVDHIKADAIAIATPILTNDSLPIHIKVTRLLGEIMTLLQKTRINGQAVISTNKRVIALYLLRHLIRKVMADSAVRSELLYAAKETGEFLIETLVGVSKNFGNIAKSAVDSGCCMSVVTLIQALCANK